MRIKNIFLNLIYSFKIKVKSFFSKENIKYHLIGFLIAVSLLITNIIVGYNVGYFTEHNKTYDATPYVIVLLIAFGLYFIKLFFTNKKSATDLIIIIYIFLLFWDLSYKFGFVQNDLLIPSPEGLFYVFKTDYIKIWNNVLDSLELLFFGFLFAIISGTILGLIAGWFKRASEVTIPITNVITLIPPVLITAWLIMWFPFKIAAIAIIFLAVFWPTLQGMITRVSQIDKKIIDAAKVMGVGNFEMIYRVVLP